VVYWEPVYAEGNAWQYLWYAPHDLDGLATLLGGRTALMARLDEFFMLSMSTPRTPLPERYYWHGNEPDIHAPWMPSAYGDAVRASRFVHWVRTERYTDGPDGIPGNDDAGTLSAWYLFAALGMYPLAGTDQWLLAAPLATRAEVTLAGGRTLTVEAPNAGTSALRLSALRWNNRDLLGTPTLTQSEVAAGGRLVVELSP
jgi:putative alpha-1,2-mannosidase